LRGFFIMEATMSTMKVEVVCSYCRRSIAWKECEVSVLNNISKPVSHGICSECFQRELEKLNATMNPTTKK
jgi:hypothetical protein